MKLTSGAVDQDLGTASPMTRTWRNVELRLSRIVLVVVTTLITLALSAQHKKSPAPEQTEFSAEDTGVRQPVAIPEDVLSFLRKDELVKSVLENENQPEMKLPQSWFSASAIHLEDRSRADLVVVGEPPLAGANVVPFWIFRTTPNGHSLVLRTGGHGLSVLRSKHNGLCDIETTSVTMQRFNDTVYRFDGSRYVIFRDTSKPNR